MIPRAAIPTSARPARRGMTLVEVLMALSIVSLLAASVASAVKGSLQGYADNTNYADLAQASRTAANKILSELRLADDDTATVVTGRDAKANLDLEFLGVRHLHSQFPGGGHHRLG